jgi:integrase
MSRTKDLETIAKRDTSMAEMQAELAKMRTENEELRKNAFRRRHETEPGQLSQNKIDAAIAQARKDGQRRTLVDGGNLHLLIAVKPHWTKGPKGWPLAVSWLFRWGYTDYAADKNDRKQRYKEGCVGLGSLNSLPLEDARKRAKEGRALLAEGKNPKTVWARRKYEASTADTFRTVDQLLDEYLDKVKAETPKDHGQVTQRFRDFVRPFIGSMPVQSVTMAIIEQQVLRRNTENPTENADDIWKLKHPTANEVRRHLGLAFKFGMQRKYRTGDNPAQWSDEKKEGLKDRLPRSKKIHKPTPHPSLNFRKLAEFMQQLDAFRHQVPMALTGTGKPTLVYAIRWAVFTGARISEVLKATFDEMHTDPEDMFWLVPGERTKSGMPRKLPITTEMLEDLTEMRKLRGHPARKEHALVFPGTYRNKPTGKPISSPTLMRNLHKIVDAAELDEIHNHGWRSTFKDWCVGRGTKACPGYHFDWYRMQCDHWDGVPKYELVSYGPDRHLDVRRLLMQAYCTYATTPPAKPKAGKADNIDYTLKKRSTA